MQSENYSECRGASINDCELLSNNLYLWKNRKHSDEQAVYEKLLEHFKYLTKFSYFCSQNNQKRAMEYTVIIHKDEKSGWYTGKCVQVPGAMSQGRTLDELIENMKDAISLMLDCYKEEAREAYAGEKVFYRKVALA